MTGRGTAGTTWSLVVSSVLSSSVQYDGLAGGYVADNGMSSWSIPPSQPRSQQPLSQMASPQQAWSTLGVHMYSHSGHVYFFDFRTLTLRVFAPL